MTKASRGHASSKQPESLAAENPKELFKLGKFKKAVPRVAFPKVSCDFATGLRHAFEMVDESGDGNISIVELSRVLSAADHKVVFIALTKYFRDADKNNDGTLDFDEFAAVAKALK